MTPTWLLDDAQHSFVHLLGEGEEGWRRKGGGRGGEGRAQAPKLTEHSISHLFGSQAGPKLVPGSLVFKSLVPWLERVYHKKIKKRSPQSTLDWG